MQNDISHVSVATPKSQGSKCSPGLLQRASDDLKNIPKSAGHTQHKSQPQLKGTFVFSDFKALHTLGLVHLKELAYSEITIVGFEVYIVEQWALERKVSTLITSYTGNSQDIIHAVKITLPIDIEMWPVPFRMYYNELIEYSTPKITDEGTLFITNLSSFPSTLNLLHVECGDLRRIWNVFKVNFDLKRLRCGGRSGLLLCEPSGASGDKFTQLYKISVNNGLEKTSHKTGKVVPDRHYYPIEQEGLNGISYSVLELITLVQISLGYFNLLDSAYKDGIFCTYTEQALQKWWDLYGKFYLAVNRPKNEGPLGPTTVAGLISLVLSCYFKLVVEDCISSKEPFHESAFYGGIWTFQKKYSMHKTSYLDTTTLNKLFEVTSKISNTDIFKFKKVVKSTVHDIAGKGNPIQLSNEILTTDLATLIKNIHGGCLGLLWKGKGVLRNSWRSNSAFCTEVYEHGDPDDEVLKSHFGSKHSNYWYDDEVRAFKPIVSLEDNDSYQVGFAGDELSSSASYEQNPRLKHHESFNNSAFQKEMYRRTSIPYLPKEISASQINYHNHACLYGKYGNHDSSRRKSMSVVQDAIESWTLPYEPSMVRVARDLLELELDFTWENSEEHPQCESDYRDFEIPIRDLKKNYEDSKADLDNLEKKTENLECKRALLFKDMKDLDSLASKFKYDIRVLDTRMRDVEESIEQFGSKLESMNKTFGERQTGFRFKIELLRSAGFERCLQELLKNNQQCKYSGICVSLFKESMVTALKDTWNKMFGWVYDNLFSKEKIGNKDDVAIEWH